jgi:hypothetical protein
VLQGSLALGAALGDGAEVDSEEVELHSSKNPGDTVSLDAAGVCVSNDDCDGA